MKLNKYTTYITLGFFTSMPLMALEGFVKLPKEALEASAYVQCNPSGNYGNGISEKPDKNINNTCSITTAALLTSQMNAPLEGFNLIGIAISDVPMPAPYAGTSEAVATVSDTIWRNIENTQCILGTHIKMLDAPLADGSYFEINDIARAGFKNKDVEIAYFYKPQKEIEGGNVEMLFRAGRTYTSVKFTENQQLPVLKNTPPANKGLSDKNTAALSENWVDFTTDINFKDPDGSTRQMTSMLYIKFNCDARNPVEKVGGIRLRMTGQNGQTPLEVNIPGMVPADGEVEIF